jgi:agmatinase
LNRPGARFGPQAIRRASALLDGDPVYPFGFDPFAAMAVVDCGDCVWDYGRPETMPVEIHAQAKSILEQGVHLVTLGGDHFLTYPLLKAHAERYRIDHGTMITRAVEHGLVEPARSTQIGIRTIATDRMGIEVLGAAESLELGPRGVVERIAARVGDAKAYLTFDIDCLDPAFAPGTGTPVCGGLSSGEALFILRGLGRLDFVGMDVVEVSPPYDHADITALAAATIAQHYLCLLAARRQET